MSATQEVLLASQALPKVARLLSRHQATSRTDYVLRLRGEDADLPVPRQALELFAEILRGMAAGHSVQVLHSDQLLTTQQAADLLNLSRTYLLRLIDQGTLNCTKTGTHRRVKLQDVLAYKEARESEQRAVLNDLAELDRALGIDDL